jgi:Kinesin motor domain
MENEQGKEGITGTSVVAGFVYLSLLFIVLRENSQRASLFVLSFIHNSCDSYVSIECQGSQCQSCHVWRVLPQYNSVAQTTNTDQPLPERVDGRTFFTFDKTFGEDADNVKVYENVAKGIAESVAAGLNGTIFGHQMSSGKTYTM